MLKLEPISIKTASNDVRETLEGIHHQAGFIPNILGTFAHSPAALSGYMKMQEAFESSSLSVVEQHTVQLAVSVANKCKYCMPAHATMARNAGIDEAMIKRLRAGQLPDNSRLAALVTFTSCIVRQRGNVAKSDVDQFLRAGFSEAQVMDVILGVAFKTMSNYANEIFAIDVDPELDERQLPRETQDVRRAV